MKEIKLTMNKIALVDDEDFKAVNKYKWQASRAPRGDYFYATGLVGEPNNLKPVKMHNFIMRKRKGYEIDHINNNGLDNRRENLRYCTPAQNSANRRPKKGCSSIYKGVFKRTDSKHIKWRVNVGKKFVMTCNTEGDAAMVYNYLAKKKYGEFAYLNRADQTIIDDLIRSINA